jgi:CxxC motif-containing protein (DUF1111 family)
LTEEELTRFRQGAVLFDRVFTPEEGLGPLFNENQCSACHTDPASGGSGGVRVDKATRFVPPDSCDLLSGSGGENVRRQATPLVRAHGIEREPFPSEATERGRFTPPFLFGLGLVEAIPERTILERADPDDSDGDGISGRAGRTRDGRLGRFGRKAEIATLPEFNDTALRLEMGLTTPLTPMESGFSGGPLPSGTDPVPEPEVDSTTTARLVDFVRFLALPERADRGAAHRDSVQRGERLFQSLGCADCHTPAMTTGPSDVEALNRKTVYLYSDLLLHDMGPGLADVCGIGATPSEVRTEMLMGLRYRDVYLHDGRASADLPAAIRRHAGEAQAAADAFAALSLRAQLDLLVFLRSL